MFARLHAGHGSYPGIGVSIAQHNLHQQSSGTLLCFLVDVGSPPSSEPWPETSNMITAMGLLFRLKPHTEKKKRNQNHNSCIAQRRGVWGGFSIYRYSGSRPIAPELDTFSKNCIQRLQSHPPGPVPKTSWAQFPANETIAGWSQQPWMLT